MCWNVNARTRRAQRAASCCLSTPPEHVQGLRPGARLARWRLLRPAPTPAGRTDDRLAVPADKVLIRALVLLFAHKELVAGDRLEVISGDQSDGDLPEGGRSY